MEITMKEAIFDTGEVKLNYAEGPDSGPALVLLHGGSARWQYFDDLIPGLAADWHLYVPDLRGHGRSGRVPWRYALRDYAADVAAFLRDVSGPAILFGHSLGGLVALMTAGVYPEWVRGVAVGDSPLDATTWIDILKNGREQLAAWRALSGGSFPVEEIIRRLKDAPVRAPGREEWVAMRDVFPEGDFTYTHLAERLYYQDPDVLGMLVEDVDRAAAGYEMETLLPAVRCPVLLLQADPAMGSAMGDDEAARALQLLPKASRVRFTGLSHLLFIEDRDWVLMELERFLREVAG